MFKLFTKAPKTIESFEIRGTRYAARANDTYTANGAEIAFAEYMGAAQVARWEGLTITLAATEQAMLVDIATAPAPMAW